MSDTIQFVDAIATGPTVLLDLNNDGAPFSTELFTAVPPALRRASGSSMLADGDVEFAATRADRVLALDINLMSGTQAQKAAALQLLGRMIDRPRWLRYQPEGAPRPLFFRTRRGDVADVLNIDVTAAKARLRLEIPADPYGYGLPVTSTATISNNVDTGSPVLSYLFPEILGDAPAPLRIEGSRAASQRPLTRMLISMRSARLSLEPIVINGAAFTNFISDIVSNVPEAYGEWLYSLSGQSAEGALGVTANVRPGDYRVLLRGANVHARINEVDPYAFAYGTLNGTTAVLGLADLGVTRLPRGSARLDPRYDDPATTVSATLQLQLQGTAKAFDAVILVPVALDMDDRTSTLVSPAVSRTFLLDADTGTFSGMNGWEGGGPYVVPGSTNRMTVLTGGSDSSLAGEPGAGTKTWQTSITWKYFPRYLTMGATAP